MSSTDSSTLFVPDGMNGMCGMSRDQVSNRGQGQGFD